MLIVRFLLVRMGGMWYNITVILKKEDKGTMRKEQKNEEYEWQNN